MSEYSAESLVVRRGLEPVRRRAGMYIGELREIAATCPVLTTIVDHQAVRCPDGIVDLARGARALAAPVPSTGVRDEVVIDVALPWITAARGQTCGFVETRRSQSGTHVRGLADGAARAAARPDAARAVLTADT